MTSSSDEAGPCVRIVRPRWGGALLYCGKCLKRHPDAKVLRRTLKAAATSRRAADPAGRKVRVVKVACLGLCPKRAVVVASPATLADGDVALVRDVEGLAAALPRLLPD